jgi:methionine-rich copper-binding protein CopC
VKTSLFLYESEETLMPTPHRRIQHVSLATLLSLGLLFVMATAVSAHATVPAHAKVYKAIPAIGSTIAQAPTTVTVFTLENINPDPKKSNLFVYAPSGDLISQGNAKVALNNPREMSITIKPSGNGVYIVRWITVSAEDGDPDEGAFFFNVQPSAPAKAPTTSAATTPPPTTGGTPLWIPIVVGIVALLVGLGGGFGLGRGRSRPAVSTMRKVVAEQQEPTDTSATPTKHT